MFVWKDTPQSDERPWARAVIEKYGLINHQVVCDDLFFDGAGEESRHRSEPHFGILCHPMIRAQSELLRARGVEVLLSGARAEAVVLGDWASPLHLADMVRSLRRGLIEWSCEIRHPFLYRPLVELRAAELVRFGAANKFVAFLSCLAFEYWLRAVTGLEGDTQ